MAKLIVLTGLSGAGRSVAAGALEDSGWFVIDNLPPALVPKVADLADAGGHYERVALAMGSAVADLAAGIDELRETVDGVSVVFFEASTPVLVRRYESTKRRHPRAEGVGLSQAIEAERVELGALRSKADEVIDTSFLNPHQLRERILGLFGDVQDEPQMRVTVSSFGFKHGIPLDVDLVLDCRFLPNPFWDPDLRALNGKDPEVQDYVFTPEVAQRFLGHLDDLLGDLLPAYADEGKSYLTVAFGCTGGRHRSVAVAERVAATLQGHGWLPRVHHRDIER